MAFATLTIDIDARLANLERDMGRAAHLAEQSANRMGSAFKSMSGAFKVLAGGAAGGAFAAWIKSGIDLQNELGSLSKKTGIAASDLAGLKFAADQNGASLDLVAKAVKELSVNMSATPDKFAKLGINATTATDALAQIADLVATMPDGMQKTALLAELMGKKVGPEMAEFLSQGGAAMREYIAKGKDIYKVTDENAAKAKEFKDRMAELEAHTKGLSIEVGTKLLPGLNRITTAMTDAAREGGILDSIMVGMAATWNELFVDSPQTKRIKEIKKELDSLREAQGGRNVSKYGLEAINKEMLKLQKEMEQLLKIKERLEKPASPPPDKPKTVPDAVKRLLGDGEEKGNWGKSDDLSFLEEEKQWKARRKALEELQKPMQHGGSIVSGLGVDFGNDIDKKMREINSPLMSGADKQHAENLAGVSERAARAKESIDALNLSDADRAKLTGEINALTESQIGRMESLRAQIDANNASWTHGAQVAMRDYMDEAANLAKNTEAMFSRAFKGMEDALVEFATKGKLDFSSLANSIISDMARIAIQQSITGPLMGWVAGAFAPTPGGMAGFNPNTPIMVKPSANGNVFGFANGGAFTNGIFNTTTPFRFAGGGGFNLGIMGEAGPEAVMPLTRGSDGKLGVRAQGGGGVNINYAPTIQIDSRTDQAEVHRLVSGAVKQGNAELVDRLQRQGVI